MTLNQITCVYALHNRCCHTPFRFHSKLVSVADSNKRKIVIYSGRGRPPKEALGAANTKNSQEVCGCVFVGVVCVCSLHMCVCTYVCGCGLYNEF